MTPQDTTISLWTYISGIATAAGFVWAIFGATHLAVPAPTQASIRKPLRTKPIKISSDRWIQTFISIFDSIFSQEHFSKKCFKKSFKLSVLLFLVVAIFYVEVDIQKSLPSYNSLTLFTSAEFVTLCIALLLSNILADYISLLETRWLISKYSKDKIKYLGTYFILIFDFVFTFFIFLLVFIISLYITSSVLLSEKHSSYSGHQMFDVLDRGFFANIVGLKNIIRYYEITSYSERSRLVSRVYGSCGKNSVKGTRLNLYMYRDLYILRHYFDDKTKFNTEDELCLYVAKNSSKIASDPRFADDGSSWIGFINLDKFKNLITDEKQLVNTSVLGGSQLIYIMGRLIKEYYRNSLKQQILFVSLITTFITSIWVWLFLLSLFASRFIEKYFRSFWVLYKRKMIAHNSSPFIALGYICSVSTIMIGTITMLFYYFVVAL